MAAATPDIVLLQESWCDVAGDGQPARLGGHLGLPYVHHTRVDTLHGDWGPVNAIVSRWPLRDVEEHALARCRRRLGRTVLRAVVDGPRGELDTYCVALDWPPQASHRRQDAVDPARPADPRSSARRRVGCWSWPATSTRRRQSDEIRMLTGLRRPAADGLVLFDALEAGGTGGDGATWSRANPWAGPILLPERRIDYVFTGWPLRGGAGSTTSAELIGTEPVGGVVPSDHYGVLATLRYSSRCARRHARRPIGRARAGHGVDRAGRSSGVDRPPTDRHAPGRHTDHGRRAAGPARRPESRPSGR